MCLPYLPPKQSSHIYPVQLDRKRSVQSLVYMEAQAKQTQAVGMRNGSTKSRSTGNSLLSSLPCREPLLYFNKALVVLLQSSRLFIYLFIVISFETMNLGATSSEWLRWP